MRLFKFTDGNNQTYRNTQWGPGVTQTTNGEGPMPGPGWLHAYTNPLIAVLLSPAHINFIDPVLWEAEGDATVRTQVKAGCTRLTTVRRVSIPHVTNEQRIAFALLCAQRVYPNPEWTEWASKWLSGKNRSKATAKEVHASVDWGPPSMLAFYVYTYEEVCSITSAYYATLATFIEDVEEDDRKTYAKWHNLGIQAKTPLLTAKAAELALSASIAQAMPIRLLSLARKAIQ